MTGNIEIKVIKCLRLVSESYQGAVSNPEVVVRYVNGEPKAISCEEFTWGKMIEGDTTHYNKCSSHTPRDTLDNIINYKDCKSCFLAEMKEFGSIKK